jgi:hypothetical protein
MTDITTKLTRQIDRLVHKTADEIAGDDCMEALQAEAELYRFLAHICKTRIAQAKAIGLGVAV